MNQNLEFFLLDFVTLSLARFLGRQDFREDSERGTNTGGRANRLMDWRRGAGSISGTCIKTRLPLGEKAMPAATVSGAVNGMNGPDRVRTVRGNFRRWIKNRVTEGR